MIVEYIILPLGLLLCIGLFMGIGVIVSKAYEPPKPPRKPNTEYKMDDSFRNKK